MWVAVVIVKSAMLTTMSKVLVGMSGGVDSSASAVFLLKAGYEVAGVTMKLWESDEVGCHQNTVADAKAVADKLGIPHYTVDFTKQFKEKVTDNFVESYLLGHTPNPCVNCNQYLKFGAMLKYAEELGADYIATGHYAKVEKVGDRYLLKRCGDQSKDQTYFLYTLTQHQLSKVIFPLCDITKSETREVAKELGLSVADKKDSQEICFIPDDDYVRYITDLKGPQKKGDFILKDGTVVGQHQGIINYTIGQRKGLGIALNRPVYVTDIDAVNNTVTLADNQDLFGTTLYAEKMNYIPFDAPKEPFFCTGKIRYRTTDYPCTVYPDGDNAKIVFDTPQRAITKGQSVVLYDGDIVIGGGIING